MRLELTKTECRWLADLANKARIEADQLHAGTPHPLLELRRDNMADLENKLNTAIQKDIQKNRRAAR
jgi:hypothetical protein